MEEAERLRTNGAYLCKTSKKSRINGFSSRDLCTPLTTGLGVSRPLSSGSGPPSSLASRFLLVDELMEAGESGRDNAATPLTCTVARPGEAMSGGGVCDAAPRRAADVWKWWWSPEGDEMVVFDEPGLSRRFAFAKGGCSGLGTSSKKTLMSATRWGESHPTQTNKIARASQKSIRCPPRTAFLRSFPRIAALC
jgi:hypothetical protein